MDNLTCFKLNKGIVEGLVVVYFHLRQYIFIGSVFGNPFDSQLNGFWDKNNASVIAKGDVQLNN